MSAVMAMSFDIYPEILPWRQIFDDMKAAGYAYSKQATMMGTPWSTYQDWMAGKTEPRYSHGVAILAMHKAICGPELTAQRQREGRSQV